MTTLRGMLSAESSFDGVSSPVSPKRYPNTSGPQSTLPATALA